MLDTKTLYKAILIFGGGYLVFWMLKPKSSTMSQLSNSVSSPEKTEASFDGNSDEITMKERLDASEVMNAYKMALTNNEPPTILSELNRECMKDYGMKCYQKKDGSLCVVDTKGREIPVA